MSQLRAALVSFLFLTLLTGVAYPLVVTGAARLAFPKQASGSLLVRGDKVVGSSLIGQPFDDPKSFWGRTSSTSPAAYNAGASSGSNLGPTSKALVDEVKGRVDALRTADPSNTAPIPVDLVTSSASGLDPEVSPAAAEYQVGRVARARHVSEADVRRLVLEHTKGRELGVLGEPRVNVLELNLALDAR
jgi:K+-transporting ATPase ATPase C chain